MKRPAYFGQFGGMFVPETLFYPLEQLTKSFLALRSDAGFKKELAYYLREYAGRPTPLYFARNLSEKYNLRVYLKREDLLHTGAHKINNSLGQILLARKMGKKRIIAETGAGQHGVSVATVCALFSMPCVIYMGEEDIQRQRINVNKMRLLNAQIVPVSSGSKTLKDACNEALRDWVKNVKDTYYLIGSTIGPYPYPVMVRQFQSVIGKESRAQIVKKEKRLPDYVVACVGGGSNSMGIFHPFVNDHKVKLLGVEAAGLGVHTEETSCSLVKGKLGVFQGTLSYVLQDSCGQIKNAHSVAPGLDYPGVGPEHAYLKSIKRAEYICVDDTHAVKAFQLVSQLEGIIPALESSHALSALPVIAKRSPRSVVIVCVSGRGDKDMDIIEAYFKKHPRQITR